MSCPSERAWAYRMYLEADKKRLDGLQKIRRKFRRFRSDDEIGKSLGISGDTLRNYIQLTELRQELIRNEAEMLKYKDALTAFEQKHGELLVADLADTDVYKLYHDPIAKPTSAELSHAC